MRNFALEVKHKSAMKLWLGLVYMAQATAVVPPAYSYAATSVFKGQMKRLFYETIQFINLRKMATTQRTAALRRRPSSHQERTPHPASLVVPGIAVVTTDVPFKTTLRRPGPGERLRGGSRRQLRWQKACRLGVMARLT